MNSNQLKEKIVEPVLISIGLYSPVAVNLLLGTAAQESHMGRYLTQIVGPALSIYQIEPTTAKWLMEWCERKHPTLYQKILKFYAPGLTLEENLLYSLAFSTCICRLKYFSIKAPMPENTMDGLGQYWKQYYNTPLGKGTVDEFVNNYKRYVL